MPTIDEDEDDDSIISEDLSNEKILNRLYGFESNENKESLPGFGVSTVNSNDFRVHQKSINCYYTVCITANYKFTLKAVMQCC